ncbi:S8 family peptidase [Affinirhizobium pseudoryzae]|uniref:S8 family peptidase n=1 Tax=Allorhizobium pseudoryzae TaxID=379684 RepID=UPI0013ECFD5E|nr:S8 family serine peptidase [Allorhizobium pseudoryzae]
MKPTHRRILASSAFSLVLCSSALAQDFQREFDNQWGLKMIGIDKALEKGLDGKNVLVGITDSGLQVGSALHPELVGRYRGLGIDGTGEGLTDVEGHGTHVAGIIAANRDGQGVVGVASGAEIVPLRITFASDEAYATALQKTLRYGLDQGVRIFNASFGYSGPIADYAGYITDPETAPEIALYRQLVQSGGVMVFAAGNDGFGYPSVQSFYPLYFPELTPGWMTVVAVNSEGRLASYSQACGGGVKAYCVAAPGGDDNAGAAGFIESTFLDGTYAGLAGTSMAAPHVTGALAIARQLYPNASYQQLAQLVFQTSTDIGAAGLDDVYGWGLLNVGNMVATQSPEAGALYAQSLWSHGMTLDRVGDAVEGRSTLDAPDRSGFWFTPLGSKADLSLGSAGLSGRYTMGGFVGGVDYALDDRWSLGLAFGYSRSTFKGDNGNRTDDSSYHVAPSVSFEGEGLFADATLGASVFNTSMQRKTVPGMAGTVLGNAGLNITNDQDDRALWAMMRAGVTVRHDGLRASPYLYGRAAHYRLGAINESGTGLLGLKDGSEIANQAELGVGIKLSMTDLAVQNMALTPSLDVSYGRRFGDIDRSVELLGSSIESTVDAGRNRFRIGAELLLTQESSPFEGTVSYHADISEAVVGHTLSAHLEFRF